MMDIFDTLFNSNVMSSVKAGFEVVSRFADAGLELPKRQTTLSAGYDLPVAEDIVIPSYHHLMDQLRHIDTAKPLELKEVADLTKTYGIKPTLVSTGMKCKLPEGFYLSLSARSSTPLKYWLIIANAPGIIDADYYNSAQNEGEIYLQVINLAPFPIQLRKGDTIGQAIIAPYGTVLGSSENKIRVGGFGSSSEEKNG